MVYVSVVDFLRTPNGAMFEFSYAGDHKEFGHTIEYILPGWAIRSMRSRTRVLPRVRQVHISSSSSV